MIKIILCDDDPRELSNLESMVNARIAAGKTEAVIQAYASGSALNFDLEDAARADLYILDIDMPGTNGIALAKKIRELYPNAMLFFYTSHTEYATEGYRVEARRFLIKGGSPAYFDEALDYAFSDINRLQKDCISFSVYHGTAMVPVADIKYIQKEGRRQIVHTFSEGPIETNESLGSLYKRISRPYFIYINRGTIINVDFVRRMDQDSVMLFGGEVLEISRGRLAETRLAIGKYWKTQ